jgi:hypothetical protein
MIIDCPYCHGTIEADDALAAEVMDCPLCTCPVLFPILSPLAVAGRSTMVAERSRAPVLRAVMPPRRATPLRASGGAGSSREKGFFWIALLIAVAGSGYYFRGEWLPLVSKWIAHDESAPAAHAAVTTAPFGGSPEATHAPAVPTPEPESERPSIPIACLRCRSRTSEFTTMLFLPTRLRASLSDSNSFRTRFDEA